MENLMTHSYWAKKLKNSTLKMPYFIISFLVLKIVHFRSIEKIFKKSRDEEKFENVENVKKLEKS